MDRRKPFQVSQQEVLAAYRSVKTNRGAGGVDGVDFEKYEANLKDNLYKPSMKTLMVIDLIALR